MASRQQWLAPPVSIGNEHGKYWIVREKCVTRRKKIGLYQ